MSDTGPAKLPGLPALRTTDAQLNQWAQAVNEHLEVRNGARGNTAEKVVVQRDMADVLRRLASLEKPVAASAAADQSPASASASTTTAASITELATLRANVDALSRQILAGSSSTADARLNNPLGNGNTMEVALRFLTDYAWLYHEGQLADLWNAKMQHDADLAGLSARISALEARP